MNTFWIYIFYISKERKAYNIYLQKNLCSLFLSFLNQFQKSFILKANLTLILIQLKEIEFNQIFKIEKQSHGTNQKERQGKMKALLYPYLPFTDDKINQYTNLQRIINDMLTLQGINVKVSIREQDVINFYDLQKLVQCFDEFDIIEMDIILLENVQNILKKKKFQLVKWSREQLDYFQQVYHFQWSPSQRKDIKNNKNNTYYIASPGLMCSDFVQSINRSENGKKPYMQKIFDNYSYSTLYAGYYLNKYNQKNLDTMNYEIEQDVFDDFIKFFLQSQSESQDQYNHYDNYCTNDTLSKGFGTVQAKSSISIGYSEEPFNCSLYFNVNEALEGKFKPYKLQNHIMGKKRRRLVYLDQFVAKATNLKNDKKTILAFNKFMISDAVLNVFTKGLYLNRTKHPNLPQYTYLLPPTKAYFQNLGKNGDQNYKKLFQLFIYLNNKKENSKAQYIPIYGEVFFNEFQKLTNDIKAKLR